jgi:hypothetical protein
MNRARPIRPTVAREYGDCWDANLVFFSATTLPHKNNEIFLMFATPLVEYLGAR